MAEARLFQALSDPTRLRIVTILARGPSNVTGIVDLVRAAQPAVSRHLRILREVGLIHDRRLGKEVEYSLDAERVEEASGWLGELVQQGGAVGKAGKARGPDEAGKTPTIPARAPSGPGKQPGTYTSQAGSEDRSGGTGGGESPKTEGAGPAQGARGKLKRISPLAARRGAAAPSNTSSGVADEKAQAGKEPPGGVDVSSDDSRAGVGSRDRVMSERTPTKGGRHRAKGAGRGPRGKRAGRSARRKPKSGSKEVVEREVEGEPAYIVRRQEDPMDDFLL